MKAQVQRILVPTDLSPAAGQVVEYGVWLAEKFGAELHLLHVVTDILPSFASEQSPAVLPDFAKPWVRKAEETLATTPTATIPAVRTVKVGNAVREIVRYAKDHQIDLIVIGTHGLTGLVRLLLGSVAEKVLRIAPCPVLSIHPRHDAKATDLIGQDCHD